MIDIELHPLAPASRPAPEAFLAAARESAAALGRWMPWYHADYGAEDVARWYAEAERMWQQRLAFPMAIVEVGSGRFLGGVGLHDVLTYGKREAEAGYWVRRSACGQGVAATALRAMAAFGFNELKLARVSMRIRLDNRSSRRAAERAGARFEGVLRNGLLVGETPLDAAVYSLLPADLVRPWLVG